MASHCSSAPLFLLLLLGCCGFFRRTDQSKIANVVALLDVGFEIREGERGVLVGNERRRGYRRIALQGAVPGPSPPPAPPKGGAGAGVGGGGGGGSILVFFGGGRGPRHSRA